MTEAGLRAERARKRRQVRAWERGMREMDPEENPGGVVAELERVRERLAEIAGELQQLRKSGLQKRSRTDADSRFLHSREGFVLGYTAEAVVSEDGVMVGGDASGRKSQKCSTWNILY
jgi:hypothetical protein